MRIDVACLVEDHTNALSATVTDTDGAPLSEAYLNVMPSIATSEAVLAAAMISGAVDQKGVWKTPLFAPGKYYVLATSETVDKSPESIGKLWQRRTSAKEIDLGANATAAVSLTMTPLD